MQNTSPHHEVISPNLFSNIRIENREIRRDIFWNLNIRITTNIIIYILELANECKCVLFLK